MLGLLAVNEVEALGLEQLVSLSTSKSSKDLLGELVLVLYYGIFNIKWCSFVSILQGNLIRMEGVGERGRQISGTLKSQQAKSTWVAVLVLLHGLEGGGTGNELVGPVALVGLLAVDFVVVLSESEHCVG